MINSGYLEVMFILVSGRLKFELFGLGLKEFDKCFLFLFWFRIMNVIFCLKGYDRSVSYFFCIIIKNIEKCVFFFILLLFR